MKLVDIPALEAGAGNSVQVRFLSAVLYHSEDVNSKLGECMDLLSGINGKDVDILADLVQESRERIDTSILAYAMGKDNE